MQQKLSPEQHELIMDWVSQLTTPYTIYDMAQQFKVHYQTAYNWNRILELDGTIVRHPFRQGRKVRYIFAGNTPVGDEMDPDAAAIKITRGTERFTIAQFTCDRRGDAKLAIASMALMYMFRRSYYADNEDYQHLRGPIPLADIKRLLTEFSTSLKHDYEVLQQLLTYHGPWVENSELARRFGTLPIELQTVFDEAEKFEAWYLNQQGEMK